MAMYGQRPHRRHRQSQRHRRLPLFRLVLVITIVLLLAIGIVIGILNVLNIVRGSWFIIVTLVLTGLGSMVAVLQWHFPVGSGVPVDHSVAEQPPPAPVAYRGVVVQQPHEDPRNVQRDRPVKKVYEMLINAKTTAIMMRGISGIGKSKLAELVYFHAEEQRSFGKGPFTSEALWLKVDAEITLSNLAGLLFETLGEVRQDFANLAPQNQAEMLFNLLNTQEKARLVILDFKNPLDEQTGSALADCPGFSEWLNALNSQSCRCRVLLTNCPWSQGIYEHILTYMKEYYVKGLEEFEGVELLQNHGVQAIEEELRTIVKRCDGHPGALTQLLTLLRDFNLNPAGFLEDPAYARIWMERIATNYLERIYQRLNELERKLLLAISVYQRPVPLEAVQALITNEIPKDRMLIACLKLKRQHLLRDLSEGNRYQLHTIVADFAQYYFDETNMEANKKDFLQIEHLKAAQYYLAKIGSASEKQWQSKEIQMLIEAVCHYIQAHEYNEAYNLLQQEDVLKYLLSIRR